jgi:hypothetical protein
MSQAKLRVGSLSVIMLVAEEASPELSTSSDIYSITRLESIPATGVGLISSEETFWVRTQFLNVLTMHKLGFSASHMR